MLKSIFTLCALYTLSINIVVNARQPNQDVKNPQIIGLIAARNESIQITHCIKSLAPYVDGIIYLDDASDDNSIKIVQTLAVQYKVKKIIQKTVWLRDEPADRNALLNEGRAMGGTHFIVIDADEMFTANCLNNNFLRNQILNLKPGDELLLNWIQLWRSVKRYRFDNSVWTWNYKNFVFCDDGVCSYNSEFIHTPRCPINLHGKRYTIEGYEYGLMHFQFVNWRNLLIKQAWYRCLEHIRNPSLLASEINNKYAPSKNEAGLGLRSCPKEWFDSYTSFFDAGIYEKSEIWREKQVIEWFKQYNKSFFSNLDIWDIDWGTGLK